MDAALARARTNGCSCSSEAGFDVESLWGWFDRRPYAGGEDMIFAAAAREPV